MIPITKAVFDEEDLALIQEPLRSGWVVQGKYVREFEDAFSSFTGAPQSVATTSCTTALQIAISALGIKPGDEVIVPAFTWISTANVIEHAGARAVFVDVDLETFNLEPVKLDACLTPRTVGVIPVHLFGLAANMTPVMSFAASNDLWVVEDAACGFDTWYKGAHVGTIGNAGCFSFHPRKAITTGEGGMITTADDALAALSRTLRDHGASRTDLERHVERHSFLLAEYHHLGFNYRMTDIQGALGVGQMRKAAAIQRGRRAAAARYDALLADVSWLRRPYAHPDYRHGYQSYVCCVRPNDATLANVGRLFDQRNRVMSALEAEGIVTRQGTHAPPHLDYYRNRYCVKPADFPNAYLAERLSLTLPLYADMTEDEQVLVVDRLCAHAETLGLA